MTTIKQNYWTRRLRSSLVGTAAIVTLFLLIGGTQMAKAQNLILNGSFELPVKAAASLTPSYSGGTPTNWTVTSHYVTLATNGAVGGTAEDGSQWLQLQATGGGGAGTIQQSFSTTVGALYDISFYYADLGGWATAQPMTATIGSTTVPISIAANGGSQGPWTQETFNYTATATTTTLSFTGNYAGSFAYGPGIDNVSVIAVVAAPEPSSVMLMGLGAMALVLTWRRRNKLV